MNKIQNFFRGGKMAKISESQLYLYDRHLYIEEAPEPNNINWEFINTS